MIYNKFDIKQIAVELGSSFCADEVDSYKQQCNVCGATITQRDTFCVKCKTPVVWLNSSVWSNENGSPKLRIRELEGVLPTTRSGILLIKRAGLLAFQNKRDEYDWAIAEDKLGFDNMKSIIDYVFTSKRNKGRGGMRHAIAIVRNKMKDFKRSPKNEPEITTEMW